MGLYAALRAAQWVVGKALAPVADGVLGAWAATKNFGPNVEALSTELLLVKATLEQAAHRELGGPAMEMLLQKLWDSAQNAEDLLDELDYFHIHDELHGTYEAADEHGKGCVRSLALNARHTAKAVGKLVNCCAWQRAKRRQRSSNNSSSSPNANQEVSRCMPKLGKLFPCSSSPHTHVGHDNRGNEQETPKLEFNRVDFSQRMKGIVEKLQLMRNEINKILIHCEPRTVQDITQSRPITKGRIDEPKLYGRDHVMNSIIHDIIEGQYCDKSLTVIPVVGPGGMGKTTLIQHIYRSQQVQYHFPVMIWICVSLSFNLDKVLEQIKACTPKAENEREGSTTEDLIEQRLKSKRFLLVLDDIWQISNEDDWGKLLSTLNQSQEKGSMILVTTRFQAIVQKVGKTGHSIKLKGLESEEFRKLFLAFVFGDEQYPRDKQFLLETGDEIMEKLKGSPLAAKTVGRLLSKDLNLGHWKRVLKGKGWEKQTDGNEIMPALKLSYDFLPFHLQQCFAYSSLFPEDYYFGSDELISLWIGLDILIPNGHNQTLEDIGLSNLNELVIHGFFREEEYDYSLCYVMHDLLHDLALKVASHDCLSLHLPSVGSVEIQPTTRHLSISTEDLHEYDAVFGEKLKSDLEELTTRFKVRDLQTLMLFGQMDEGFVKILGDFFGEANALRVLHLPIMVYPVESMLHNFSGLVHLRCLWLGTWKSDMHLPPNISKFYNLRILNLGLWFGSHDLPEGMSNLGKLCHFYGPDDEIHSDICNVGKLKLLEELKVFRVNKKSEGFEPKQLEHLTKLRELGIYNLEKVDTVQEAAQAKLLEKKYLRRLTLEWDSKRTSVEPSVEAAVLESLQPHGDIQVLCIRGHGGPSYPTWLGVEFTEALQSLYLCGVSWEVFPSLWKAWNLHEIRLEDIARLKEVIIEKSFCMLTKLKLIGLENFEKWVYPADQESSFGGDLLPPDAHMFPLLQVLTIRKCPKLLGLPFSNHIVSPDWFPKLEKLKVHDCPEFLPVIAISWIGNLCSITMKCVKMLKKFAYSKSPDGAELKIVGEDDLHTLDQVLVFDKETCLEQLTLKRCPPLELKHLLMLTSMKTLIVEDSDGGDLLPPDAHMLPLLQVLIIRKCPKPLRFPISNHIASPYWFPKLQELEIQDCPEFSSVIPISWIESLCRVRIRHVKMLKEFTYSKSSDGAELNITGKDDLHSLDQVLFFDKETCIEKLTLNSCPPLDLKHLLMLTSLKILFVEHSDCLVGQDDVEWQLPVEHMRIWDLNGNSGEELTELLPHLPKLSKLEINGCRNIKKLVVGVNVQQTTSEASEEEDDGVLLLPAHLCDSLLELELDDCPELVLVDPPTLVPSRGCLQALRSLQRLTIKNTPKLMSALFSRHLFPSSLQFLTLWEVEGMGSLEPLSNLSSVTVLALCWCGENLKCQGLQPLLTTGGQLNELKVSGSPRFFAGWDPNPKRALEDIDGGGEQQAQLVLSTLLELYTDGIAGLLSAPVCSFLSSSLTKLELRGRFSKEMERFTKEQEDALQLLSSLQELKFWYFRDLQQLPAGLHNLTSLKKLTIDDCPAILSLPNDSLPKSLQELDVTYCINQKLKQQCRGLVGIIPKIRIG